MKFRHPRPPPSALAAIALEAVNRLVAMDPSIRRTAWRMRMRMH